MSLTKGKNAKTNTSVVEHIKEKTKKVVKALKQTTADVKKSLSKKSPNSTAKKPNTGKDSAKKSTAKRSSAGALRRSVTGRNGPCVTDPVRH